LSCHGSLPSWMAGAEEIESTNIMIADDMPNSKSL
jgi:hypothetical protein